MNKTVFALIFCVFFSSSMKAQMDYRPGYVIKHNGDTIFGFIDYRSGSVNAKKCVFKANEGETRQVFNPGDIRAYRIIDGKYYISKEININNIPEYYFVEYVVNSRINVYFLFDGITERYFIENEKGEFRELIDEEKKVYINNTNYTKKSNEYVGVVKYFVRDSPVAFKKADNMKLQHKDLIEIVQDYNSQVCPDEECILYEKMESNPNTNLGISLGINTLMLRNIKKQLPEDMYYLYESNFGPTVYPSLGFFAHVNFPGLNEKLWLHYEASFSYVKLKTNNIYYNNIDGLEYLNDLQLKQLAFGNVILFRKEFGANKLFRPSINYGGFANLFFNSQYNRKVSYRSTDGYVFDRTGETSENPFLMYDAGFSFGGGFISDILSSGSIYVDLRYQYGFGLIDYMDAHYLNLNIGLVLK